VTVLALFAVLFGTAYGSSIQLLVFPSSNQWWLAVDPMSESGATSKMEVQEAGSSAWTAMTSDMGWGYFTYQTSQGSGFSFPLSFRFTDASGNQVVASNVLASVAAGSTVDTGVAFGSTATPPSTVPSAPNCGGGEPTTKPTNAPTSAPATQAPATQAPTRTPSSSNGNGNGHGHGSSGSSSSSGSATQAPTTKPTNAPTTKPTSAPTTKPTSGHGSSSSSGAATQAPTTKPTTKPTAAPTSKPTTKPSSSSSSSSGSSSGSSTDLCTVTPNSQEPLQILVPLYVEPGSAWDELVTAAGTGVKIIAIINPNSGPGTSISSSYKTYMQKFAAAGIDMVGYVHTSYGARSISDVTSDISTYASLYTGLKGIFIDECSADSSELSYYQQVYSAITSHSGYTNAILNPGTQPDQGYLDVSTNIVVFESPASSFKSSFASWVKCAPSASEKSGYKYKFSAIAYAASSGTMSSTLSSMSSAGMGMVYVTDGAAGCCTYNTLASYFSSEASAVSALN